MSTSPRRLLLVAWLGLLLAGNASAQTTGAIAGAVTDAKTGRPIAGVTVSVEGPAIEGSRTAVSDAGGAFTVPDLPAGTYALTAATPGYGAYRRGDLAVKESTTLRAQVRLAPEGAAVEEVVVTGTRIRRKDLLTPAPVTVIDREQIEASGAVGLGEFVQLLSAQGNGLNAKSNRGNDGQVRVNLRSLGSKRTLVLVNGRRMVSGSVGESVVDLNAIPLAAVERIEILKDGGSPIYGSDAIAGVVNVILKDRFEGTEISALGGVSSRGDAQSVDVSLSTGIAGERGSAFFSVGWQEQRPVMGTARSWAARPLTYDFESRSVQPGGSFYTGNGAFEIADAENVCAGDPGGMTPALQAACAHIAAGGDNLFVYDPASGTYRPRQSGDTYNFQEDSYLLTPARRLQLFSAGHYALLPEVRAFYEASFVNRRSSTLNPPMPVDVTVSGQSTFNEFGTDLFLSRRLMEFGRRVFETEQDTFRIVTGLDGELGGWAGPLQGWRWELSYLFGRNTSHAQLKGLQRAPSLDAGVGPSFDDGGVPTCGTPAAPAGNCVPIDLMHGVQTLSPEQRREIGFTGIDQGFNELQVLSANANGRLFMLWSDRPVSLAGGLDFRWESGGYFPDPVTAAGESTGNNQEATSGSYSSSEAYAELSIPVVSDRLALHDLELLAALRASRYSSFGSHSTYKLGARWAPVEDVTFRGTWSTAFRAPDVLELHQGSTDSFVPASDPCADGSAASPPCPATVGGTDEFIKTIEGGNPALQPETAKILTAGVVLQPRWVRDLSLTLDYWDIHLEDTVDVIGTQVILNGCYTADPADSNAEYCSRVQRNGDTGSIASVDDRLGNIGGTRTSGVDLAARWAIPARSLGRFQLSADATYLATYDKTFPDGSVIEAAGTYDLGLVLPRWRWDAGLGWRLGGLGASAVARYIGSFDECADGLCSSNPTLSRRVSSNLVFDVEASYDLRTAVGTTALQLGVRNVLDSPPPMVFTAADNNTDPMYDFVGRYYWARLTQAF
jgi:outer membrane receptor protein involved in Fe transport